MTERQKTLQILLVEDNPADADLLEHVLRNPRRCQFTLVRAGRLDEGLSCARSDLFDILLLDLNLPDSRGIGTVERTSKELPGLPFIVLTGVDDEDLGNQALQLGAQDFLVKGESDGWATWRAIRYAIERMKARQALGAIRSSLGMQPSPGTQMAEGAAEVQREIARRISVEKRLEEKERLVQHQLAEITHLYASAPVGLALMDADFRFLRVNDRLAAINGKPVSYHIGRTVREIVPELADRLEAIYRRVLAGEAVLNVELHGSTPADPQAERDWLASYCPVRLGQEHVSGIGVVVQDITHQKRTEDSLRQARATLERRNAELRELAIQLCRAEQIERNRVAEVLHDDLQQLLCSAKLTTDVLLKQCEHPNRAETLKHLESILGRSLATTRTLVGELVPPVLKENGLAAALEWLSRQMAQMHGLKVLVQGTLQTRPRSVDIDTILYRCVRELLFNVVKHAGVGSAVLRIRDEDHGTRVEVCDEGVGFRPAQDHAGTRSSSGFGLATMRDRMALLGGRLEVRSAPGQGTTVLLFAPWNPS